MKNFYKIIMFMIMISFCSYAEEKFFIHDGSMVVYADVTYLDPQTYEVISIHNVYKIGEGFSKQDSIPSDMVCDTTYRYATGKVEHTFKPKNKRISYSEAMLMIKMK